MTATAAALVGLPAALGTAEGSTFTVAVFVEVGALVLEALAGRRDAGLIDRPLRHQDAARAESDATSGSPAAPTLKSGKARQQLDRVPPSRSHSGAAPR